MLFPSIILESSWCFYKNNQVQRKNLCPPECIKEIKFLFDDLTDDNLIKGCVDGFTQNVNEGFNALIWRRFLKTCFARINSLKWSVADAVLTFNEGYISKTSLLNVLGFKTGHFTELGLLKIDKLREKERLRQKFDRTNDKLKKKKYYPIDLDYGAGLYD